MYLYPFPLHWYGYNCQTFAVDAATSSGLGNPPPDTHIVEDYQAMIQAGLW
jgi:hypothetical protein